ncbi:MULTISPECIES: hypothetical protein [unclassified Thioalkalivibrio]|uniref:hypothetical protein n=1 Tax=unclassified Thioalkalivibrio TaxID=2621013 RepID=UPI000378678B|nr:MULTISPECIES: hypothetical protein [unclassified Thioalkalivibrio]
MGATVYHDIRAGYLEVNGTPYFALCETSRDKKSPKSEASESVIAFGTARQVCQRLFDIASSCAGGMLQGPSGMVNPETYVRRGLKALNDPGRILPEYEASLESRALREDRWGDGPINENHQILDELRSSGLGELAESLILGEEISLPLGQYAGVVAAVNERAQYSFRVFPYAVRRPSFEEQNKDDRTWEAFQAGSLGDQVTMHRYNPGGVLFKEALSAVPEADLDASLAGDVQVFGVTEKFMVVEKAGGAVEFASSSYDLVARYTEAFGRDRAPEAARFQSHVRNFRKTIGEALDAQRPIPGDFYIDLRSNESIREMEVFREALEGHVVRDRYLPLQVVEQCHRLGSGHTMMNIECALRRGDAGIKRIQKEMLHEGALEAANAEVRPGQCYRLF